MEESGEVSAMVSGMKYYAHDPIDIEDLNGKRRRGERIDKPSGTTYRPSNPDDPREKELKMTNISTEEQFGGIEYAGSESPRIDLHAIYDDYENSIVVLGVGNIFYLPMRALVFML